jgi:hypothetical protein
MRDRIFQLGIVALLVLMITGCVDPKDRRPGLRLSGEVVGTPIDDWSFSDQYEEIFLESQTWYKIPHSVTTVCAARGEKLYVPTLYFEGGQWPDKFWNANVDSNPHVRLKIGDQIYEREAVVLEEPAEFQLAFQALADKYPFWQELLSKSESERPDMALLRMDPRSTSAE